MKRWSLVVIVAVLACTGMLAEPIANASSNLSFTPKGAASTRSISELEAVDVVRGVFFGRGPIAKVIGTTLQLPDSVTVQDYDRQVDSFIAEVVRTAPPSRIKEIAQDLTSGSAPRVERALNVGTAMMKTPGEAPVGSSDEKFIQPRCGIAGAFCVAVATVGVVSWVVAQNAVAVTSVAGATQAVVKWNGMWTYQIGSQEERLARETAVARLASDLAR